MTTRRDFLKAGAVLTGSAAVGFGSLFGYKDVFAQDGDDAQTILNLAATAETLATTHYFTVLTDSNIALTPREIAIFKNSLDAELQHLEFLNANGAETLATEFFYPRNVYMDREQFSEITELQETAFVAAYLAATRRIAELGNPLLAATAAQIAVVEQAHLALIRQLGDRIPNNVSLGQALFYNTSDVVPVFQFYLEGGPNFEGTIRFPGADTIRDFVRDDGVVTIKPYTDPTLFGNANNTSSSGACMVTSAGEFRINVRSGPGLEFRVVKTLAADEIVGINAQARDRSGVTWYRLTSEEGWIRSDVVNRTGDCNELPTLAF